MYTTVPPELIIRRQAYTASCTQNNETKKNKRKTRGTTEWHRAGSAPFLYVTVNDLVYQCKPVLPMVTAQCANGAPDSFKTRMHPISNLKLIDDSQDDPPARHLLACPLISRFFDRLRTL